MDRFRKVIVLGFDGLEPGLMEAAWARGALPHLARLREGGRFARVATTLPAQTPVAWSTFVTGVNPGAHGVFDFVARDPATYQPRIGLNRYEQKSPFLPPRVVNLQRAPALWDALTAAGIPSVVLRCPCTYPPGDIEGRLLAGQGVPDIRGSFGIPTYYTTDAQAAALESEQVVLLAPGGRGPIPSHLPGPRIPSTGRPAEFPLSIEVLPSERRVVIQSDGQPRSLSVQEGCWSDWLKVKFRLGTFQSARGMVRFFLRQVEPEPALVASPVQFDPASPLFPISAPGGYARDLERAIGTYATAGMVEEHTAVINGRIDESAFLAQCDLAWREREAMLRHELGGFRDGLLYCLFDTPDRIQHLFWRFLDPEHPANRVHGPGDYADAIAETYRHADRVVGEVMESVDDRTLLVVLSDHGFGSFRRGVNLNTWLHEQGLLALKAGRVPGPDAGEVHESVDWSRTSAYAIGMGGIYLNLRGREGEGIVTPEDAGRVAEAIRAGLAGLVDPETGETAVRGVVAREDAYHGEFVPEAPDLLVLYSRDYRASWGTSLGETPAGVFEENTRRWSGDHVVDPALVPGALLTNRPFEAQNPRLQDLAPTILQALGVPAGKGMEGESLFR